MRCLPLMEVTIIFIYPDNLKAKAQLWFWTLNDMGIISLGLIISVFSLVRWETMVPMTTTGIYAIVSIRLDEVSILNFLRWAAAFLLLTPQHYEWRPNYDYR